MSENQSESTVQQTAENCHHSPDLLGLACAAIARAEQESLQQDHQQQLPLILPNGTFNLDIIKDDHQTEDNHLESEPAIGRPGTSLASCSGWEPALQESPKNLSDSEASEAEEEPIERERDFVSGNEKCEGRNDEMIKCGSDHANEVDVVYESGRVVNHRYRPECHHYFCRISDEEMNRSNDAFLPCEDGEKRKAIHDSYRKNYFRSTMHHIYEEDHSTMRVLPGSYIDVGELNEVFGMFQVDKKDWGGQTPCRFAPSLGSLALAASRKETEIHCECLSCEQLQIELTQLKTENTKLSDEVHQQTLMLEQTYVDVREIANLQGKMKKQDETIQAGETKVAELRAKLAKRDAKIAQLKVSLKEDCPPVMDEPPSKKTKKVEAERVAELKIIEARKKIFDDNHWHNLTVRTVEKLKTRYPADRPPMLDVLSEPSKSLPKDADVKDHQVYYVCYGCGFTAVLNKAESHRKKNAACADEWLCRRLKSNVWTQEREKNLREICGLENIKRAVKKYSPNVPEL
ncbi:hypothetical protein HDE_06227 [Halotydeus destructor]|nr:hypothetical protein HDE_06227 [Halotydeus destructor]